MSCWGGLWGCVSRACSCGGAPEDSRVHLCAQQAAARDPLSLDQRLPFAFFAQAGSPPPPQPAPPPPPPPPPTSQPAPPAPQVPGAHPAGGPLLPSASLTRGPPLPPLVVTAPPSLPQSPPENPGQTPLGIDLASVRPGQGRMGGGRFGGAPLGDSRGPEPGNRTPNPWAQTLGPPRYSSRGRDLGILHEDPRGGGSGRPPRNILTGPYLCCCLSVRRCAPVWERWCLVACPCRGCLHSAGALRSPGPSWALGSPLPCPR